MSADMTVESRVAPFAGAWIETAPSTARSCQVSVASFAGAWVETGNRRAVPPCPSCRPLRRGVDRNTKDTYQSNEIRRSPPSRGRGLKLLTDHHRAVDDVVAPFA